MLIQSHGAAPEISAPPTEAAKPAEDAVPDISDKQRASLQVDSYDLDLHLVPASSRMMVRAKLTVRNIGDVALTHISLQVSSSLKWESVTLIEGAVRKSLPVTQHLLDTDADHTGKSSEVVLTLPAPLAPGASLTLDTFYSGTIVQDSTRLQRLGANATAASEADWDAIATGGEQGATTALRGFGDVLWYPVSVPQLFLGQGAQLFEAAGKLKLAGMATMVHLRLAVDYLGDPPSAAYFCGRRKALKAVSDNAEAPVVSSPGVASADFPEAALGFRALSLFVLDQPETLLPANPVATNADPSLAVESSDEASLPLLFASAKDAAVVLKEWLGLQPLTSLTVLDHAGQPFEDGALLVVPVRSLIDADAAAALTYGLAHAWVDTGQPWMDEGLAQFFVLLSVERTRGREAAEAQLAALVQPLVLAEIAPQEHESAAMASPVAQPLIASSSEFFFRRKAAAVWWMLRDLAGDDALKQTLQTWRARPQTHNTAEQEALLFESQLEKISGKDLHWFFNDWVLHDRGLPDLSIGDVTPRELVSSTGRKTGWLVAVTVRNDGAAVADVPVVVHANSLSATARIRVPGFATVTQRVLIEAPPTEVIVNDGTTPEQRTSSHNKGIAIHAQDR